MLLVIWVIVSMTYPLGCYSHKVASFRPYRCALPTESVYTYCTTIVIIVIIRVVPCLYCSHSNFVSLSLVCSAGDVPWTGPTGT